LFPPVCSMREIDSRDLPSRVSLREVVSAVTTMTPSRNLRQAQPSFLLLPGHFHSDGNFVLHGNCQERRRVDFEIREGRRNGSSDPDLVSRGHLLKGNLLVLGGLAGKLDLQIGVKR